MRIRVEPGHVVPLGGRRSTSQKGGVYELTPENEAHEWRIRHAKGVTVLSDDAQSGRALAVLEEAGLTLEEAADMSDEELLGTKGIGPATLTAIREAAAALTTE